MGEDPLNDGRVLNRDDELLPPDSGVSFGGHAQRPRFGLWSPEGSNAFSSFTHPLGGTSISFLHPRQARHVTDIANATIKMNQHPSQRYPRPMRASPTSRSIVSASTIIMPTCRVEAAAMMSCRPGNWR